MRSTAEQRRARSGRAILQAITLDVICPHCGESQPDPDAGSMFWTVVQVRTLQFPKMFTCVSCEDTFSLLGLPSKVQVES